MGKPEYAKCQLPNGVTLVVERHGHVRSACIGVWVRVGSCYESSANNGISHFLEHMVFKGTENRSPLAIATALESLGGDLNAFTDKESTCYHATVLSEHLENAFDILSDLLLRPTFPKVEFERERKVLLQELSMVRDSPEEWIGDEFFKAAWPDHPLGRPVIGTKENLKSISRASAIKFFQSHYTAENIVIAVAGNVQISQVKELCEKYFTFKKSGKAKSVKPVARPKFAPKRKSVTASTEQTHLLLGFEGVAFTERQRFEVLLLSFFLGGGMSSRLFQEIREKAGLAYSVDCDSVSYSMGGIFSIGVAMAPRSLPQCLSILRTEIERLKTVPLREADLNLVKGQLRGTILLSADQMETRQESLGRNEAFFGRYVSVEEVIAEIESVTPDRVQAVANRLFVPEKEAMVVLSRNRMKLQGLSVVA